MKISLIITVFVAPFANLKVASEWKVWVPLETKETLMGEIYGVLCSSI
jgi:hypothetical protein